MKKYIINTISYILVLGVLFGLLAKVSDVLEMKNAKRSYDSFFDKDENYDVFFIGSSKVINGIYPMQLWRDYGITSYNLGAHASYFPGDYWMLVNALDVKTPKAVVVDMYGIGDEYKYASPEYLHNWMDRFPLTMNKIRAIRDLNNDPYKDSKIASGEIESSTKASDYEFIWNFVKYHSRWTEVTDESFNTPISTEKGAEARLNVYPIEKIQGDFSDEKLSEDTLGVIYLRKIIDLCKERGIEVVLINLPSQKEDMKQANTMSSIASEYSLDFVDFDSMDVFDYSIDFYDDRHLNPLGAFKTTDFLGKYLTENKGIISHKEDDTAVNWDEDYRAYSIYRLEHVDSSDSIENSLIQIKDKDFVTVAEFKNSGIMESETYSKLISNLGVDVEGAKKLIMENGTCFALICYDEEAGAMNSLLMDSIPEDMQTRIDEQISAQELSGEFGDCNVRLYVFNEVTGYLAINEY